MRLKSFLQIFGGIAVVLTLIPLIAADYWWIRIFDFPHTQLTILTLSAILLYFFRFDIRWTKDYAFMTIMLACFVFQLSKIYPYTPLASFEVLENTKSDPKTSFKIFTSNVLQSNEDKELLLEEIGRKDPDLMIICEADKLWQKEIVSHISSEYRYKLEVPLENTYGMLLYSKFRLINPKVHYMVDDSIPSIHTKFLLPSNDTIQLYAIHPTPPMPQHNPSSSDRDAEMMLVADMSRKSKLPVIVMGDFNDVAWSNTTSLFKNAGELLDLRIGRGFFNTYNAKNPILRWPLDHIFISEEFRVIDVKRGNDIHSDHFPSYAYLSFEPQGALEQKPHAATIDQLKRANDQIKKEKIEE